MVTGAIFYACLVQEEEKMRVTKTTKSAFTNGKTRQIY